MAPRLLLAAAAAAAGARGAGARPNFAENLPNAYFVPCAPSLPGCPQNVTDATRACRGLGHVDCRGGLVGSTALNPFGVDFLINNFQWTAGLCQADSDGDGYTNGEELGDPCCSWLKGSKSSETDRLVRWPVSHPGFKDDTPMSAGRGASTDAYTPPRPGGASASERWQCESDARDAQDTDTRFQIFNAGEPQLHKDLNVSSYEIPCRKRTTYVNFFYAFDDAVCTRETCSLVGGTVHIDHAPRLHHFVLFGCTNEMPASILDGGELNSAQVAKMGCSTRLAAWAPGVQSLFTIDSAASIPLHNMRSFRLAVHYDNGVRLHYTTAARPLVGHGLRIIEESVNMAIKLPPRVPRNFLTQLCVLVGAPTEGIEVTTTFFHGHLVATEMFNRLYRRVGGSPVRVVPDNVPADMRTTATHLSRYERVPIFDSPSWWFDDQYSADLTQEAARRFPASVRGTLSTIATLDESVYPTVKRERLILRNGDILHGTCVFNTTERMKDTPISLETTDEMCWVTIEYIARHDQGQAACIPVVEYTGQLSEGESVDEIWHRHGYANATFVDASSPRYVEAMKLADVSEPWERCTKEDWGDLSDGKKAEATSPACYACIVRVSALLAHTKGDAAVDTTRLCKPSMAATYTGPPATTTTTTTATTAAAAAATTTSSQATTTAAAATTATPLGPPNASRSPFALSFLVVCIFAASS